MVDEFHTPVLLDEVITGLDVKTGKKYIDATVGGGGHGLEIVRRGGLVLGIDIDQDAIDHVKGRWKVEARSSNVDETNLVIAKGNFRDIGEIARANGFGKVAGVLFDLGVSLHQLKTGERGFSFQKDGPLDMRMSGKNESATAADLVNGLYEHELSELFEKYGGERDARRIAHAICGAREVKKIETTGELTGIIERVKKRQGHIHPATNVFQALRIAVNDELGSLEVALPQAVDLLEEKGRIGVISFHSLEDRIVKQFFQGKIVKNFFKGHTLTKKPIIPTDSEIDRNPRARSAKLRIYKQSL